MGLGVGAVFAAFPVTPWLSVRVDLATHDALHAPDLVLVHADDRMGCIRFAAGRWAICLDLASDRVSVFFEDGVHPCLFWTSHAY
jgi:hypothetical protein